jgi:AcrR family transcriptional regulator
MPVSSAPAPTAAPGLNRHEKRRQKTRATILDAADRVFRRKGVDGATVNDVTEEADLAYATFYNHFKTMDEVVAALAEQLLLDVANRTGALLAAAGRVELLPCIGARIVIRTLSRNPAIGWLLDRPQIFVEAFHAVATPFMRSAEEEAVRSGTLSPAGGHDCWLEMYPWMLMAELRAVLGDQDLAMHEIRFAMVSLRFLGIDDRLAAELIAESVALVP